MVTNALLALIALLLVLVLIKMPVLVTVQDVRSEGRSAMMKAPCVRVVGPVSVLQ